MVLKALRSASAEDEDEAERDRRHAAALMRSRTTRANDGGQQAADELDQAGADEVADAFHVGHDARDQHAGFVGIVVGDGQAADVLLHFAAQFGDQLLAFNGKKLGE